MNHLNASMAVGHGTITLGWSPVERSLPSVGQLVDVMFKGATMYNVTYRAPDRWTFGDRGELLLPRVEFWRLSEVPFRPAECPRCSAQSTSACVAGECGFLAADPPPESAPDAGPSPEASPPVTGWIDIDPAAPLPDVGVIVSVRTRDGAIINYAYRRPDHWYMTTGFFQISDVVAWRARSDRTQEPVDVAALEWAYARLSLGQILPDRAHMLDRLRDTVERLGGVVSAQRIPD